MYNYIITFLASYVWGSVSFAVMVCKAKGLDIFSLGSKNAGATNVSRILGKPWGRLVFCLDFLKGALAVGLALWFFKKDPSGVFFAMLSFLGVILGHSFSCFYKFRGGKAVATSMGGLLVLAPFPLLIGLLVWLGVFYGVRYVSVASMAFGLSLPISSLVFCKDKAMTYFCFGLMLMLLLLHAKNIKRLWQGLEKKV